MQLTMLTLPSGIEFLVKDPIFCRGYLLVSHVLHQHLMQFNLFFFFAKSFCEECYNAENMLFLIVIEKFRENLKPDLSLWPGKYKEIDNLVTLNPDKEWIRPIDALSS